MRRLAFTLVMACLTAACSGGGGDDGPSAEVTVPDRTTTSLSAIEREVEAAYLKSWDVYADAALRLTTERLAESYAGAALAVVQRDIETYRKNNTPARYSVEHEYTITVLSDSATVNDRYINHSVLLDESGREPIEQDPNKVIQELYRMQRIEDAWKVTSIERF